MGGIRVGAIALGVLSVLLSPATDARAQYFGRNKVEYANFDYRILATAHFDVYHDRQEERAARIAAELAERWYARFARELHHEFTDRQPLVLYGSQPEFAQTNVVSTMVSDTVGGVTEGARRRIAMPFAPTLAETDRILGHEIAHAFQFDIARQHRSGSSVPLWFIEGMAEYLARGATDSDANRWIRDVVATEKIPRRERDAARQFSPYHYGHAFWAYLAGRFSDEVIEKALKPGKHRKLKDRMLHATGATLDQLYADWRAHAYSTYRADPPVADSDATRLSPNGALGRVQLGPALSPDGRSAVFFSERDGFALDLFLADVDSGRIVRKLATTTASARFDSLQPLRSAGAWRPDGSGFVFPVVRQGHAALILFDMRRPGRDREISFPTLGQILSVSWAPDGRALAFSALANGFTNLFIYDVDRRALRQLTDDAYADLHPAWSPNGREIAFASDRFSSDLQALRFGRTKLALIDVDSGAVRAIPATREIGIAAEINPQWSVDGRELFFIGDRSGVSNVFRLDLANSVAYQVTDVATGVTGLTSTSPALSVATQAGVLAFTRYGNRAYELLILDDAVAGAGRLLGEPAVDVVTAGPAVSHGLPEELLHENGTRQPQPEPVEVRDYSPALSLERIGQPYVSTGGGAFGTFVRAGGSLLFGDMLGERRFGVAVQVANRLRDVAFEVRFLNREHQWNWGMVAELEPALRRYRFDEALEYEGEPALQRRADYLQRVQLRVAGLVAYPFSRALRVELAGGVRHEAYHRDVRSQVTSAATGRILDEARVESSGGAPTTVGEVGAALVHDTTVFGLTGPMLGSRYRFEVAPAAGDLTYTRVLADYRQYLMPIRPYTIATRVLLSGRYGGDSDDPRLFPNFLGSRSFVRGHGLDTRRCHPDPSMACGGELMGNRLLVGNLEVRVPLAGMLSGRLQYGRLPIDTFVFADGGLVWSRFDGNASDISRRTAISSIGMGVRVNAGGLPFEIAAVRALDGPARRWFVDFGFRTGF
jgi:Tol biopolymer transport system component